MRVLWQEHIDHVLTKSRSTIRGNNNNNNNMPRFSFAIAVISLVTTTSAFNNGLVSGNLRKPAGWQPSLIDELGFRLDALEEAIPLLEEKIRTLEAQISELHEQREMQEDSSCPFIFTEGVCQLNATFEALKNVSITGSTKLNDLFVGKNLEIFGNSTFGAGVNNTARAESGLAPTGRALFFDLDVGHDMQVKNNIEILGRAHLGLGSELRADGDVHFEGKDREFVVDNEVKIHGDMHLDKRVLLEGQDSELRVDGDVHLDRKVYIDGADSELTVDGNVHLGTSESNKRKGKLDHEITIEGISIFKGEGHFEGKMEFEEEVDMLKKTHFKDDVDIQNKLTVETLKVLNGCEGC